MDIPLERPVKSGSKLEKVARNEKGQFPPGTSGNPAGKPKGRKHFATIFMEVLQQEVNLGGKKMTMSRAMTEAMVRKAIRGDVSAFNAVSDRVDGKPTQDMDIEVTENPTPIYGGLSSKPKKV